MAEMGRPPHFETPELLQAACEDYFEYIKGESHLETATKTHKDGSVDEYQEQIWDRYPEPPTITGLALFLGFESRQSIYDYAKNGDFSYIIKTAKLKVENGYEKNLSAQQPTGSIFALKNMGWIDSQSLDHTTKGDSLNKPKDLSMLTNDELKAMAAIQRKINAE